MIATYISAIFGLGLVEFMTMIHDTRDGNNTQWGVHLTPPTNGALETEEFAMVTPLAIVENSLSKQTLLPTWSPDCLRGVCLTKVQG